MSPAKKLAILTEQQILEADDLKEEVVEVPEWNGSVKFKQLTRGQYNATVDGAIKGEEFDGELFDLLLLIATQVEPQLTPDRVEQLRGKSAPVIRRLAVKAHQFNNVSNGAFEDAMARFQGSQEL